MREPTEKEYWFARTVTELPTEFRFAELLAIKKQPVSAVPTPFPSWSKACRDAGGGIGVAHGWHCIVAARSGLGKSVLALNIATCAIKAGQGVFFVSLEMSGEQVETRLLALASGTPAYKLEAGRDFNERAYNDAQEAFTEMCGTKGAFFVNQKPLNTLDAVTDAIRWAHECNGCDFIITDYLQLAASDPNEPSEIVKVSHAIRGIAQDLGIVSIGISQFNRATSASRDQPTIFGLMGGSAVENDADQVIMLDHSRIEQAPMPSEGWVGYALLGKNRHGPLADIPIHFNTRTLQIRERMPDEVQ